MDLFSCLNCVQNPMQGIHFGRGHGYCLQWGSVLENPGQTTCKYLCRKDLPRNLVEEGVRDHAREFAHTTGPTDLISAEQLSRKKYSERYRWDTSTFDPAVQAMAMYHRGESNAEEGSKARFIQAFVGSTEGRRAMAYASLVRRYMNHCDTWVSSYRLVLAQIEEIGEDLFFPPRQLREGADEDDARWEVFFAQISTLQEFGWHAALKPLQHPLASCLEAAAEQDWEATIAHIQQHRSVWRQLVISKAQDEGEYFPQASGL